MRLSMTSRLGKGVILSGPTVEILHLLIRSQNPRPDTTQVYCSLRTLTTTPANVHIRRSCVGPTRSRSLRSPIVKPNANLIGHRIVHAYWRIAPQNEFRSNIAVGGSVSLESVPQEALDLALHTALFCRWDDVGIDICRHEDNYYVLEANMKYGKEGFRQAGIDYTKLMANLIENEEI